MMSNSFLSKSDGPLSLHGLVGQALYAFCGTPRTAEPLNKANLEAPDTSGAGPELSILTSGHSPGM